MKSDVKFEVLGDEKTVNAFFAAVGVAGVLGSVVTVFITANTLVAGVFGATAVVNLVMAVSSIRAACKE